MKFSAWIALSRPAFHVVGVLPFVLGGLLAWRQAEVFRWDIFAWGTVGVVLVMMTTYFAGEYWDYAEDALSARTGSSRFSGGSQVLQRGFLPRKVALWSALGSMLFAVAVGLILQLGYQTGLWTIVFGVIGILGGFFYSARPIRWVSRGLGEVWIAFCYGWLPVAVGYYLQTAQIIPLIHWLAAPIALTIFNVILLNEFPDYQADLAAGKTNLTVRLGREQASRLYGLVTLMSWVTMMLSLNRGVPTRVLWFYVPIQIISLVLIALVMSRRWLNQETLEKLCAANLLVNVGTTATYIFAFAG